MTVGFQNEFAVLLAKRDNKRRYGPKPIIRRRICACTSVPGYDIYKIYIMEREMIYMRNPHERKSGKVSARSFGVCARATTLTPARGDRSCHCEGVRVFFFSRPFCAASLAPF